MTDTAEDRRQAQQQAICAHLRTTGELGLYADVRAQIRAGRNMKPRTDARIAMDLEQMTGYAGALQAILQTAVDYGWSDALARKAAELIGSEK